MYVSVIEMKKIKSQKAHKASETFLSPHFFITLCPLEIIEGFNIVPSDICKGGATLELALNLQNKTLKAC